MAFGFYYPTKAGPVQASWTPSKRPTFPLENPSDFPDQLSGETSGGTLYVQEKGVSRQTWLLNFRRITTTDRDSAKTFFEAVQKSLKTFQYEDVNGTLFTVRWMNAFEFRKVVNGRWSGSIVLREE